MQMPPKESECGIDQIPSGPLVSRRKHTQSVQGCPSLFHSYLLVGRLFYSLGEHKLDRMSGHEVRLLRYEKDRHIEYSVLARYSVIAACIFLTISYFCFYFIYIFIFELDIAGKTHLK